MAPRKRAAEAGGLPPSKRSRLTSSQTSPPSSLSTATSSQQAPRSSWVADDELDAIGLTQDDGGGSSFELYGSFDGKIVGVRFYNGAITPGEMVLCRREPGNPYDSNAIRVDNVMRNQIGHLPRTVAAKLAPLIDQGDIILEGAVTGYKDTFDCPIRLYIYGTGEPSARKELENKLKAAKLLKAMQLKSTRQEAEARRKASELGLKSGTSQAGLPQDDEQGQNVPVQQLLGVSEVADTRAEDLLKGFSMDEKALSELPMASQPDELVSQLLPYQLQVW